MEKLAAEARAKQEAELAEYRKNLQKIEYAKAEAMHRGYMQRLLKDPDRLKRLLSQPTHEKCTHLKGGQVVRSPRSDYAVTGFTFPDGHSEIRCMVCGKTWDKDYASPEEWEEAMQMMQKSTNTWASSEIIIRAATPRRLSEQTVTFFDNLFETTEKG